MSNTSLFRIPFIFLAMAALHVSATPPNPPPEKGREVLHTRHDRVITQGIGRLIVEAVCMAGAVAEIACILATNIPYSGSQDLLALLCPAGIQTASRIGLSPLFFLGIFLTVAAGFIRYASYVALGPLFTFEVAILNQHRLITNGPYAYVRHPSYTGVPMTVLGIVAYHLSPGSWFRECGVSATVLGQMILLVVAVVMVLITSALVKRTWTEDALMKQNFGPEWDAWAERVPYRLIPGVY
ncbi:hypothetical protein ONZ45_g6590 [Pleurotus djamor]|nr:hypothetical protein ONZ45_g6590 [Pleurotus djamor]